MGFLSRMQAETRDTTNLRSPAAWLLEALGATKTHAGVSVNPMTARGLSAAYACINVIAQDVAKLPAKIYKRQARGRELAADDPRWALLHASPNPWMTAYTFHYCLMSHALGWGNGYAEIEWSKDERTPLGLWPLMPDRTCPEWRDDGRGGYEKVFRTTITEPDKSQRQVLLPAYRVLHLVGPTIDGLVGRSPIADARQAIGVGLAAQEYAAKFFSQGANMGLVAYHPNAVSEKAEKRIRSGLEIVASGLSNAHRLAVFEEGIKLERIGVSQEDSQFLETKKENVVDVARYYRVPPHKIQDLARSTNNNIEQQALEYLQDCLSPWIVNLEQAYNAALFRPEERRRLYVKFNVDSILRADSVARADSQQKRIFAGSLSPNEAREENEQNPLPSEQGDIYILPANYTRSELIGQQFGASKEKASRSDLAAVCRRLLEGTLERIVRREARALVRVAKAEPEGAPAGGRAPFAAALSRELAEIEAPLRAELASIVAAFGEELFAPGFEVEFARSYVRSSSRQLLELAAAGPQAVLDRLASWEETKAATLARLALEGGWQERSDS